MVYILRIFDQNQAPLPFHCCCHTSTWSDGAHLSCVGWVLGAAVLGCGAYPFEPSVNWSVCRVPFHQKLFVPGSFEGKGPPCLGWWQHYSEKLDLPKSLASCPHPRGWDRQALPASASKIWFLCWGDWGAWLFLRGRAWTWYWVTAWHPMLSPPRWWKKGRKKGSHGLRASAFGARLRACRRCCVAWCPAKPSLPGTEKRSLCAKLWYSWVLDGILQCSISALPFLPSLSHHLIELNPVMLLICLFNIHWVPGSEPHNSKPEAPCACVVCFCGTCRVRCMLRRGPWNPDLGVWEAIQRK